jgi:membrane-associated protease RseP (regulator of RpoE activity)
LAVLTAGALAPGARAAAVGQDEGRTRRVEVVRIAGGGARLGVELDEVDKNEVARLKLSEERGAVVRHVEDGSPAAKAGLLKDDVVLEFQGEKVQSASQLARLVRETPPGRTVTIAVGRGGATQRLSATLGEGGRGRVRVGDLDAPLPPLPREPAMPREPALAPEPPEAPEPPLPPMMRRRDRGEAFNFEDLNPGSRPRRLGIEFDEVSGDFAKSLHVSSDHAVVVTSVLEGSVAARAGFKPGDVILRFAGREIRDASDLRSQVRRAEDGKELSVAVQRDGKPLDLKVTFSGEERRRSSDEKT